MSQSARRAFGAQPLEHQRQVKRTISSLAPSVIFLPTSLFIQSSCLLLEPLEVIKPGTTRGMVAFPAILFSVFVMKCVSKEVEDIYEFGRLMLLGRS